MNRLYKTVNRLYKTVNRLYKTTIQPPKINFSTHSHPFPAE